MPGLLDGKFGLIATLSERHSYSWGIAQACLREGARLAFAHQDRYATHVADLTEGVPGALRLPLDVADDQQIARTFEQVEHQFGGLDFLIHTPAFAPPGALMGRLTDTSRPDFQLALDVSAYSLLALTRAAEPLFKKRGAGSVVGLTYYGGEKVVLGYKVMGIAKAALDSIGRYLAAELGPANIRVNLLSLGSQRTIAARGIPGFLDMYNAASQRAPLRRNIETADAGNAAVFLCSDWGRNVTGEILHVDAGYNTLGI